MKRGRPFPGGRRSLGAAQSAGYQKSKRIGTCRFTLVSNNPTQPLPAHDSESRATSPIATKQPGGRRSRGAAQSAEFRYNTRGSAGASSSRDSMNWHTVSPLLGEAPSKPPSFDKLCAHQSETHPSACSFAQSRWAISRTRSSGHCSNGVYWGCRDSL